MKFEFTSIEKIIPGDKILLDNSSAKGIATTNSSYPGGGTYLPPTRKVIDPDDGIYLVMNSTVINETHYSSYFLKVIVLRSKIEPVNAYISRTWGGELPITKIEIDEDELALLDMNQ